jgi:putative transcriptional regulator
VSSGSPATFVLRLSHGHTLPKTVDAALSLARRGISLSAAKRAMDELLLARRVFLTLPTVEDRASLTDELAKAGIAAAPVDPASATAADVRALRAGLRLTREQFGLRYGLDVETIRNWEAGRREPDMAARSYLRAIKNDPERVEQAYAPTPSV